MRMKKSLFLKVMVVCTYINIAYACSPKMQPALEPNIYEETNAREDWENDILQNINQYRRSKGLSPLRLVRIASQKAMQHSRNMAARNTGFGHEGFDNRITDIRQNLGSVAAAAENVAYGKINADAVVKGWIKSAGHRKNIVGNYQLTGIGVAKDAKGIRFFTQIFLRQ